MTRQRLPNRRDNESREIEVGGRSYLVTVGFDPAGQPREIFIHGAKAGSEIDTMMDDAAVMASIALQHGATGADLARSLSRASVLGAAIDWLVELET